jgi:N-acetylglucosamine-6-phosphate deacetylase
MFVAGSDLKEFSIGGMRGAVSDDGTHLRVLSKENTLFGSNLTMDRAFENMLNWLSCPMAGIWNRLHEALEFEEAVSTVAKIYSRNPCDLTGLAAEGFGRIENGAKADICVLDITGSPGNYKVKVELTVVDGKVVYSKT